MTGHTPMPETIKTMANITDRELYVTNSHSNWHFSFAKVKVCSQHNLTFGPFSIYEY